MPFYSINTIKVVYTHSIVWIEILNIKYKPSTFITPIVNSYSRNIFSNLLFSLNPSLTLKLVWTTTYISCGSSPYKLWIFHPTTTTPNFSAISRRARKLKFCTDTHYANLIQSTNCHCDICPCNICTGDICPYQEYLSCY